MTLEQSESNSASFSRPTPGSLADSRSVRHWTGALVWRTARSIRWRRLAAHSPSLASVFARSKAKALRKLRQPSRSRKLKAFLVDVPE